MLIVIALGGNAFVRRGRPLDQEEHLYNIDKAAELVAKLVSDGHKIVVTHGNGPQVGLLDELQLKGGRRYFRLDALVAATQGLLGYFIANAIDKALGTYGRAVAVVTRVSVDPEDPSFKNPSKFIGPSYAKRDADLMAQKYGFIMREEVGRGWRRVVPSPEPMGVMEVEAVKRLLESGFVVIAAGGGGVPTHSHFGVEAVVDKDLASQVLANSLGADAFIILTDVDGVYLDYGTERQRKLERVSADELLKYYYEGRFEEGSMGPKVLAAARFVKNGGAWAAIGALDEGYYVFKRERGTIVERT